MGTKASGAFEVKSWNEETYEEIDGGAKLTRVSVTQSFSGDFVGEGTVEYLMIHRSDGNANFVGLQRLLGRIRRARVRDGRPARAARQRRLHCRAWTQRLLYARLRFRVIAVWWQISFTVDLSRLRSAKG